jgi:uncharacterized membrane protein
LLSADKGDLVNLESSERSGAARRVILSILFIAAGILHFVIPHIYMRIMPPYLLHPRLLIDISGVAEMLGGLGLLIRSTSRAAAWGLVALLIAVWPANIYMAMAHLPFSGIIGQSWAQWFRVVLQLPLIYWAWLYTRRAERQP